MSEDLVLLVEDDEDLRITMADMLRDEGVHVAEAANGAEALGWMHTHRERPVVIVLDLMMPKMDGLEFRKAQLADPGLAPVPVVFMTASTIHQRTLEESGADEILRKPVGAEKFLSVIGRYVPVTPWS